MTGQSQVQGYDCVSTGTQAMPPSWTNNTDPNADFDTQGRVYQTTLPFNAFWEGGLHPNGAIDLSYSDDLGLHWIKGNGGQDLEHNNNQTSLTLGHVEDKQWVAVNHIAGNRFQDHVYAMWTTFNGSNGNGKIRIAVSRDRGQTFSKAVTITPPGTTTPATTYVYPSVGSDGTLYVAFVGGFDTKNKNRVGHVYVTKSIDDGKTFGPFVEAATPGENPDGFLPNTNFRDGIIENFAASPTYPGHLYLTYEDWDFADGQFDVKFTQSTDGGSTWSDPADRRTTRPTRRRPTSSSRRSPPARAAPSRSRSTTGAATARTTRASCPRTSAPRTPASTSRCRPTRTPEPRQVRRRSAGTSASPSSPGIPDQSQQKVGGITQYACAGHTDPCPQGRGFIGDYFGLAISGGQHLHVRGLDPLPVDDRRRRRRRPGLLPEPGAGNRAPVDVRSRVLS